MAKYICLVFLLSPILLNGQFIKIELQSEIDSFENNYPNVEEINSLTLEGQDITNLLGLTSIIGIDRLIISNTNLVSLNGLENVTYNFNSQNEPTYLSIKNNQNLESLNGLENFDFSFVHIVENPKLDYCNISSLCNFFKKNIYSYMKGNGDNCTNVFNQCELTCNTTSKLKIFHEGFEIINELHHKTSDIGFDGNEMFEIIDPIGDGRFSLKIRNNSNFMFEGPSSSYFLIDTIKDFEVIDIEFTYQCLGEGFCLLTFTDYNDPWWRSEAGNTNTYTVCLEDVSLKRGNTKYNEIQFAASPIYTGLGSYGYCEFIIDDINIYVRENNQSIESEINIFPNPVLDWININSNISTGSISIFDSLGRFVRKQEFTNILEVTNLSQGIYFMVFEYGEKKEVRKFIKT